MSDAKPITLDEISQRINTICDDFIAAAKTSQQNLDTALDALGAAITASPDLDKDTVGAIVLGRVNRMMVDAQKVFGQ